MIFLSFSYFREEAIATSVNALDHYVIRGIQMTFRFELEDFGMEFLL
jgi:hypothetical protein